MMANAKNIEVEEACLPPLPASFRVDYEGRLVEEAVLSSMTHHADQLRFRSERDRLYEIQDAEERDNRFQAFHSSWFLRLKLGRPVEDALNERPIIAESTRCCLVIPARRRRDESAELFVKSSGPRPVDRHSVGLRLLPTSFLDSQRLLALLRHEFLHIADMLDPAFEYDPSPVDPDTMPQSLYQERYRALWDATIDGRLVHEGLIASSCRDHRRKDFARTFPMLETQTERAFARLFDRNGHTHPQLHAYALAPNSMVQDT